jgi:hypothetical protein
MTKFKPKLALDVLPQDAIALKDDQFYFLVEKLTSPDVARILKCQFVNCVNTFLLCKDILTPLLLPTTAFDTIRRDVCVKLNANHNNPYVVHVGIAGQIEYLTELFQTKNMQDAKHATKHPSPSTNPTQNSSPATAPLSAPTDTTGSSSTTTGSTSVLPTNVDHRSNIISAIDNWITSQQTPNSSNLSQLVEGQDYALHVSTPSNTAIVICRCKARISLAKAADSTLSLSNLYKHWKSSKKCKLLASMLPTSSISTASHPSPSNDSDTDDDA